MKKHISFGSIGQFNNTIKALQYQVSYDGVGDNGKTIYKKNYTMPSITGTGTEKIHGSNFGVSYNHNDGMWCNSRKHIITTENDNAGSAFFAENRKDIIINMIVNTAYFHNINLNTHNITLFGEWCGGGIQKLSAVSGLDKRWILFQHFKVSPIDNNEDENSVWIETKYNDDTLLKSPENDIYNIMSFPHYVFDIDFNTPKLYINDMVNIVENDVEPDSPVGNAFGIKGNIGEGIVVTFMFDGVLHRFKIKGKKHSNSKVKKLSPVNQENEQNKIDFSNLVCTPSRLEQAWQTIFGIENEINEPDIKFTGDFIRAVIKDVMKEELDTMNEFGVEPKEVNGMISKISRMWFMVQLDKEIGEY